MPVLTKINTNVIADDAVTSAKIPADAVIASDIAAGAVGISELATVTGVTAEYHKVPVYADDSARDSAIGSPANGMIIFNTAAGAVQQYNGAWATIAPSPNITSVSGLLNDDTDSTLTIFGSNFTATTAVKMFTGASGGTQIGSNATVTFNSVGRLTAVFGAGSIGASGSTAYIEVDNAGLKNRFATAITVNADPTVVHAGATGASANTTTHLGTYGGAVAGGSTDPNTVLLLNFDKADGSTDFEDSSNNGGDGCKIDPAQQAHIDTANSIYKFGTAHGKVNNSSAYFDGSDDYLLTDDATALSTNDFTYDFWVYPVTQVCTDTECVLFDTRDSGANNGLLLLLKKTSGLFRFYSPVSGVPDTYLDDTALTYNAWNHIALERHGANINFYCNGVKQTLSGDMSAKSFSSTRLRIADNWNTAGTQCFKGYFDHFRQSSVARYSSTAFNTDLPTQMAGATLSKTIPTITFTGSATQLAADEDIEFTAVENSGKADGSRSFIDTDIGLTLTNLTGGDKNKATLTGTIASDGGTTHTNMPLKLQVRKTLGDVTFSNASTTVTFGGSTKTTGLAPAMPVSGTSIAAGTTISTVDTDTQITLSANSTGAVSGGSLIFSDLTRVSHQYNGSDTIDNSDAMYTIATATGGVAPVLFNARRYIGSHTTTPTKSLTGFGFQPDMVWFKDRDSSADHRIVDSVRGITKLIYPNLSNAEVTESGPVTGFDSDGVSIGLSSGTNYEDKANIVWGWKAGGAPSGALGTINSGTPSGAGTISSGLTLVSSVTQSVNQTSGFSITKYNGDMTGAANQHAYFPHNLGATPSLIIVKASGAGQQWVVWHTSMTTDKNLQLDSLSGYDGEEVYGYIDAPTSTNIDLNSSTSGSYAGNRVARDYDYVCYAWKAVAGVSAFGTYNGDGGSARTITTGFKPKWIMIKRTDANGSWMIFDSFRDGTAGALTTGIYGDATTVEYTLAAWEMTPVSTGFAFSSATTDGYINNSSGTYIYVAFA